LNPGGPTIINTVMQVILNVVDHGMQLQQAIDAPRVHHQWLPDGTFTNRSGWLLTSSALKAMGRKLIDRPRYMGDCQGIMIEEKTGVRLGASDPRLNGRAWAIESSFFFAVFFALILARVSRSRRV
jgi:gamma-glutamyltranspeptidase/glutathione hydrolase